MSPLQVLDWLTIDGLSLIESLLLYLGIGVMLYLTYLQFRSIRRRRRHHRHRARKLARAAARTRSSAPLAHFRTMPSADSHLNVPRPRR